MSEALLRLSGDNRKRDTVVTEYHCSDSILKPVKNGHNHLIVNRKQAAELILKLQDFVKISHNPHKAFIKSEDVEILKFTISDSFGITKDELGKKSQSPVYSTARSLFYCILYDYAGQSLENCAKHFNQSHCTALYARKTISNILTTKDKRYYTKIVTVLKTYNIKKLCDVKICN